MLPFLNAQMVDTTIVLGEVMRVNYGFNRVRFGNPVPVGECVQLRLELLTVEEIGEEAVQTTQRCAIELVGSQCPAPVAETIVRCIL